VAASEGRIQVLAHKLATPYLAGKTPLAKSGKFATPVKVDVELQDGDVLPVAGGVQVLFTPGHSPDHICLYHMPSKTLVAGDLLTAQDGVLMSFNAKFTPDKQTALQSIARLQSLDIDTVITFHGGVCTDNIQKRIQEILDAGAAEE